MGDGGWVSFSSGKQLVGTKPSERDVGQQLVVLTAFSCGPCIYRCDYKRKVMLDFGSRDIGRGWIYPSQSSK